LQLAASRPIAEIRKQDPCGCNSGLSDLELLSIYCYTTEDARHSYRAINQELTAARSGNPDIQAQIASIDSALNRLSPYLGECYRTEEENGRIHSKAKRLLSLTTAPGANDVVELFVEFFLSTSLDRALSLRGNAVEIIIAGSVAGRDVSHLSRFPAESEILFKRDTHFLILEVEQTLSSCLIYLGEI
jgi:hypothetical protein